MSTWFKIIKRKLGFDKDVIDSLVLVVGQACTLRCQHCANFAPYSPKDTKSYDPETIKKNLNTILKYFSVSTLQIQGGEPLLYKHLEELLQFLLDHRKVRQIVIATNGTLLPTPPLTAIFKNPRITVRVSNYSQNVPNNKIVELKKLFKAKGVKHFIYEFAGSDSLWFDCGEVNTPYESNDKVVRQRFKCCAFNECLTLENSIIGYCSRSTMAYRMQKIKPKSTDYIIVKDSPSFRGDLWKYIHKKRFMECCRVCLGTGLEIAPAEQLKI